MYHVVMFDLDGTVIDSGRAVIGSVEYALEQFGYMDQPEEKLRTFVGPSLFDSFSREYNMTPEECEKAVGFYRSDYSAGRMFDVEVYKGIPELMKKIRDLGGRVLLVTSKPMHFTEQIISHVGLECLIDEIVAPELSDHSSDKSRLIERAVETYGLKKSECVMIGDTKYDILGAAGAGVDSIGVTYGYGKEEELRDAGATYLAKDVDEIERMLE